MYLLAVVIFEFNVSKYIILEIFRNIYDVRDIFRNLCKSKCFITRKLLFVPLSCSHVWVQRVKIHRSDNFQKHLWCPRYFPKFLYIKIRYNSKTVFVPLSGSHIWVQRVKIHAYGNFQKHLWCPDIFRILYQFFITRKRLFVPLSGSHIWV